ncbi:hypothetical protein QYE76_007428 [Lolium multiflorum]|uniref:Reverse transcriptase n=1 Tax=Lolium multiflorum TaxID=4521 RepID=A0AAD8RXP3_LOLMU|nr:hypothetical protein QYE76_007428 [Lolium multiflorum]
MSMMGEMKFFLGFEIKQLREGTFINQAKYLQDMLKRFKMTELKGVATPMVTKCHLALDPNGKEVDQKKFLRPVYDILLRIYREVLNPKVGCVDQIYGYLGNLLYLSHQHRDTGLQLDVMYFLWNEFWACIIARKAPVFAPYFMLFICSRWDNAGYGILSDEVIPVPHKAKDLKVKTHANPPRLPNDEDSAEEDSDMEFAPPADNG